jgi:hypothetical protein
MKLPLYTVAAFLCLCLMPATASAGEWWDYFDRLSGPGPFRGNEFYLPEFRIARICPGTDRTLGVQDALARDDADALRLFVTVRVRSMTNEEERKNHPDDLANGTNVRLTPFDVSVMYRVPNLHGAVDLGVGLTVLTFSGDFEQFRHYGLLSRLVVTPGALLKQPSTPQGRAALRVVKVFGEVTLTNSFNADEFGGKVRFSTGNERKALLRAGVQLDVAALVYALQR